MIKKIATVRHGGATLRVHAVSLKRAPEANNEDTVVSSSNVQEGTGNLPSGTSLTERTEMSQDGAHLDIGHVPGDTVENENTEQGEENETSMQEKRNLDEKDLPPRKKSRKIPNIIWKAGQRFQGIEAESGEFISGKIISRAGKAGKSNRNI